jgi:hypothetical protein
MHALSVHDKGGKADSTSVKISNYDQDDTSLLLKKRAAEDNDYFPEEYQGLIFGKHRFASRGVRLPSEPILLGKRRLPVEAVLLGRRNTPNEDILLSKRR